MGEYRTRSWIGTLFSIGMGGGPRPQGLLRTTWVEVQTPIEGRPFKVQTRRVADKFFGTEEEQKWITDRLYKKSYQIAFESEDVSDEFFSCLEGIGWGEFDLQTYDDRGPYVYQPGYGYKDISDHWFLQKSLEQVAGYDLHRFPEGHVALEWDTKMIAIRVQDMNPKEVKRVAEKLAAA